MVIFVLSAAAVSFFLFHHLRCIKRSSDNNVTHDRKYRITLALASRNSKRRSSRSFAIFARPTERIRNGYACSSRDLSEKKKKLMIEQSAAATIYVNTL